MMESICKEFCNNITIQNVPVGFAVGTVFRRNNGDKIGFYIVYKDKYRTMARVEDDGLTIASLEAEGVNVFSGTRLEHFKKLLATADVFYDNQEHILHTNYVKVEEIAKLSLLFLEFLIKIQEMTHVSRKNTEKTFYSDVIESMIKHYDKKAKLFFGKEIDSIYQGSNADVVIHPENGEDLAVFIATHETKALEATILWTDVHAKLSKFVKVMLVVDSPRTKIIKEHTYARATNRFPVTVFSGMKADALAAMDRSVYGREMLSGAQIH